LPTFSLARDELALDFCEVSFEIVGESLEEGLANDQRQDGVPEKFEPLVAEKTSVDRGGMRERFI